MRSMLDVLGKKIWSVLMMALQTLGVPTSAFACGVVSASVSSLRREVWRELRSSLSSRSGMEPVVEGIGCGLGGRITAAVAGNQCMNRKALAKRLEISRKGLRRHKDKLVAPGLVNEQRDGRENGNDPSPWLDSSFERFKGDEGSERSPEKTMRKRT